MSVIAPTYNYAEFITDALDSLRAQTYKNWECIVVDDGSTDSTREVVNRFIKREPRVKYLWQRNQRQSVARNTGLVNAHGQYIQFLDADDLLEPQKFEWHVKFLEAHKRTDIVYGSVRYFHGERPDEQFYGMFENKPWMPELSGCGGEILLPLIHQNIMTVNSPLIRRSVVEQVGPFDPALPPVEDWDYWIRCALAGKRFEFCDWEGTRALVRSHLASSCRQRMLALTAESRLRAKINILTSDPKVHFLNRYMATKLEDRYFLAQQEGEVGVENVARGSRMSALRQFARASIKCPATRGRLKYLLCALGSPLLSERQLRTLIAATPSQFLEVTVKRLFRFSRISS